MPMNRALRRAMKCNAKPTAALLARHCYDFEGGGKLVRVADPKALVALSRAFELLLRNGGLSLALPVSEQEAAGFPNWHRDRLPNWVTWLAVGMDRDGRAAYCLQSASSPSRAAAHDAAREKALQRLAGLCQTSGFPEAQERKVKPC
jgi:hypothetical protein